ncbi:MAG TPA: hypothetical protein VMR77_02220 [Patescibacteria group bacterium]|nr:hypothetical protein [Patescibacteria group bacterium]
MPQDNDSFSKLSTALIKTFEPKITADTGNKISVNILVSKVASYYEKLRTAMDYGGEETILRRTIERFLKRMLFLDAVPTSVAEDLVRELIWAGYFADATVPESIVTKVSSSITLYLKLKSEILAKKLLPNVDIHSYILQLLSCEIDTILLPNLEREAMCNFMFQIFKDSVEIVDDSKQTTAVQVFIAVRKNFTRDDLAFLRYKLFTQIFGRLSEENFSQVAGSFANGYKEIEYQLRYPRKDRIFNYIKKKTPPFLILYDLLLREKGEVKILAKESEKIKEEIFAICEARYKSIGKKIRTAIIRSFVFILFTKAFVALFVEGAFERLFYGQIQWLSIGLNTIVPPLLMIASGLLITTPNTQNSQRIYLDIHELLFTDNPKIIPTLRLKLKQDSGNRVKDTVFSILWLLSICLVFGLIVWGLTLLHFNPLSQIIFLFFVAIISFLAYRINQTAHVYTVIFKPNLFTPIFDFFFVPVIRVGRRLTEGFTQINFILIIIDFMIEAPFKALFGFFEQWFLFLANKREELE